MTACNHPCPTCGRHEAPTRVDVRLAPRDPTDVAREVQQMLLKLKRGYGLGR